MSYRVAHDLAADWDWTEEKDVIGFKVRGGRVVWTDCEYVGDRLRIGRVLPVKTDDGWRLRALIRYIDPDTPITLVKSRG